MSQTEQEDLGYQQAIRYAEELRELYAKERARRMEAQRRAEQASKIQAVLSGGGLSMVFQPIADLRDGDVVGLEALARFSGTPTRGPDWWFAEASQVGLVVELELKAVREAVESFDDIPSNAYLSLNLSPQSVVSPLFVQQFSGTPAERVVLEITEHAPVDDYEALADSLRVFRDRGGRLAVDDAGAGFASLRHILRLAPDIIKLDVTLTRNIDSDIASQAMAGAMATFADKTHATIVAEGIETLEELEAMRELGISHGQGFLLARPAPLPLKPPVLSHIEVPAAVEVAAAG